MVHFSPASGKDHEKGRAEARPRFTNMVGDRRIELLTSSVSRKRSTSELITRQEGILQELLAFVKFLFVIPFSPSPSESHWEYLLGFIGIQDCEGQAFFITKKV